MLSLNKSEKVLRMLKLINLKLEFDLFALKSKKANKTNSSLRFLGESMAHQSAFETN